MALVRTYLNRNNTDWSATCQVSSLNVTAGDLLVVLAGCINYQGGEEANFSISDSGMGAISWTKVETATSTAPFTSAVFYGVVGSTAASGSITITSDHSSTGNNRIIAEVHKFTGHDGVRTSITGTSNVGDGGTISLTFSTAPVSSDIAIATVTYRAYGAASVAPGSSFIEFYEQNIGDVLIFQSQTRTSSTSTACSWTLTSGSGGDGEAQCSIVVKEASTALPVIDNHYRQQRG